MPSLARGAFGTYTATHRRPSLDVGAKPCEGQMQIVLRNRHIMRLFTSPTPANHMVETRRFSRARDGIVRDNDVELA